MAECRAYPLPGQLWRHFKGCTYKIVGIGEHTESGDRLVAYTRPGSKKLWLRPLSMFMGKVKGGREYRFQMVWMRLPSLLSTLHADLSVEQPDEPETDFIVDRDTGDETDHDVGC
ncbi:MAG: DUF1653 domain-containing protein [Rhizobiaceae bacterium]|nr:DUF1653 domain-containing protein [Rhizobiaceae bacterium]MCC0000862.1 DUF1653 domain-containing protein [Methylobacteriaceae bacterium]